MGLTTVQRYCAACDDSACVSTEPCAAERSEVVYTYSPLYHHDSHVISDESATSPLRDFDRHSHTDDDDDEEGAGGSGGAPPAAVRGRYGRRYEPPDSVIVVERPNPSEWTESPGPQASAPTSGAGRLTGHPAGLLPQFTLVRTTGFGFARCLIHAVSLAVHLYIAAVLQ